MLEDDELVELFQDGETEAFDIILKRYSAAIIRFFYRICWQRELAEDLAQEVFIKLHNALHKYNTRGRFKPYIYKIAKNVWIDFLRSKKSKMDLQKSSFDSEDFLHNLLTKDPSAEEIVYYKEKLEILQNVIEKLSTEQKMVFMLYNEDMKYSEISKSLSIPEGTVKSRLHHVFNKLKKALFDEEK